MTNGQQFALSELYPSFYTFQKADCLQQFRPESAPIISVTITGTAAMTATAGTSAVAAREVYQATSAVSASAGTSAAADREVYQSTVAVTASRGTCSAADSEEETGTCACSASRATSAVSGQEVITGTCACSGSAGTCDASGETSGGEEETGTGTRRNKKIQRKLRRLARWDPDPVVAPARFPVVIRGESVAASPAVIEGSIIVTRHVAVYNKGSVSSSAGTMSFIGLNVSVQLSSVVGGSLIEPGETKADVDLFEEEYLTLLAAA